MQAKPKPSAEAAERRRRAEDRLREQHPETGQGRTEADTQRLLHELQVHQIELEMQNEELRQARDLVEAGLEKYSDLYDFAPVGYLTLAREGTIQEANFTAASLLGLERSRLVKQRFGGFVAAADHPTFSAFLQRVFESKAKEFCEVQLSTAGKHPLEVRIEAAVAASGRDCRAAVTDITERKRAEEDRLILSKLESTGILAGGIAHDFNNLLTVILLDLGLARALTSPAGELAHHLEDASNMVWMARGLTQQLITFAQGGAPVRKPTRLSGVIKESARPAVSGSRVRCEFSVADDLRLTEADEGQIGQVIRNIVLNAREAMPGGGVVSVRAENVVLGSQGNHSLPPGDYVRVSIADQGGGIPKDVLPKIFDPYFSTKQRGDQRGMGLGLTICHAVVHKHGGAITAESEAGVGTTFHIYLPASWKLSAKETAPVSKAVLRPGRILVMDDEEGVRNVVGTTLRLMGQEAELVADGQRVIELYGDAKGQGRPFDVVILDLTVRGGVGGQEAIQALRELDPAVKAIVMSGYSNHPVVLEPERFGFQGVLAKPFDVFKLQEVLSRVMGSGSSGGRNQ